VRDRITVRVTDEMIARMDALIASQPFYVSRQEVVRRCLQFVLEHPERLSSLLTETASVIPETPLSGSGAR
jgi:Arc/MetJ-type ribon-helix-helix transcriptional regulator